MKTTIEVYNHMMITFNCYSPYHIPDSDVFKMILEAIRDFANTGEYH